MRRWTEILLLIAVFALAAFLIFQSSTQEHPVPASAYLADEEITVRNVTNSRIQYRIKPLDVQDAAEKKVLEAGELHSYISRTPLQISFEWLGISAIRELEPGQAYSFRYDENNLIQIYPGSHGLADAEDLAPYVKTPMVVVEKMLEMAGTDTEDIVYDLGSGDGRIVITAAKKFGARGVGIDIDPQRIEESRRNAHEAGVGDLVEFRCGDVMQSDISEATIVTIYLLPESNDVLRPLFEEQLQDGALIVSHNYSISGWEDRQLEYAELDDLGGKGHTIFIYRK